MTSNVHKRLEPLPKFSGDPSEWPIFERSYIDTTMEFNYSNTKNMLRLRQALQGEARQAVESLLTFPDSVDNIMETLKDNFGRPEQLVNRQLKNIRKLPSLQTGNYKAIVNFSNAVQNATAHFLYAGAGHRLTDVTLITEFVGKMTSELQWQWAKYKENLSHCATMQDLSVFLKIEARRANSMKDSLPEQAWRDDNTNFIRRQKKHAFVVNINSKCTGCNGSCSSLADCEEFKTLTIDERWKRVKNKLLCFDCLKPGHTIIKCTNKIKCAIDGCDKLHHVTLHKIWNKQPKTTNKTMEYCGKSEKTNMEVWCQIVPVKVKADEKTVKTFAFIDHGASHLMMEYSLARKLGLKGSEDTLAMQWLGDVTIEHPTEKVAFEIRGLDKNCTATKINKVYTVKNLNLPKQTVQITQGKFKQYLNVNYENAQPEIILGLDNVAITTPLEQPIVINDQGAIAIKTKLGWVVYGPNSNYSQPNNKLFAAYCVKKQLADLELLMKDYIHNDDLGTVNRHQDGLSVQDKQVIKFMHETTTYANKRYEVQLLWKSKDSTLPPNYDMALKRLESVKRKFIQDKNYEDMYREKIDGYISKGYARKLSTEEKSITTNRTFYLPHFAVINPNKAGLRVVFDAAAEIKGYSLNNQLIAGPDLNKPLLTVLSKFRERPIEIVGDIKEMFLQVKVCSKDQDSQSFLWWDESGINTYVMTRMIFGAVCSPTLAQFIKNLNAEKHGKNSPRAIQAIIEKHYVDDYVDCFTDEEEAVRVTKEVIDIHEKGGFELRNFVSNSLNVLKALGEKTSEANVVNLDEQKFERVLGMHWDCASDNFVFVLKFHKVKKEIINFTCKPTKREVLSIIMSVFDPFGLVANFMITGKLLMQKLWTLGLAWDDSLPDAQFEKWKSWLHTLSKVEELKIPRCYGKNIENCLLQLHIFADASEEAVAAVAYLRILKEENVTLSFVMAKTRCAPMKYTSIPRLELQAAVVAIRLKELILENIDLEINSCHFWTDSTTALCWIKSDSRRYKQYVANRLGEILEFSRAEEWKWLPTNLNVADEGTRINLAYVPNSRWIQGPEFLKKSETNWPQQPTNIMLNEVPEEVKRCENVLLANIVSKQNVINLKAFSKYEKTRRSMAYVMRFLQNCRAKFQNQQKISGDLTSEEIAFAESKLCMIAQQDTYDEELRQLRQDQCINKNSTLVTLNPIINKEGLLIAAGRIDNATILTTAARRPIIMPKEHMITKQMGDYYHRKMKHINRNTIITEIRRKYWIPSIRTFMKSIEANCNFCKIRNVMPKPPIMGQLPADRLTPYVRPFSYTGLDYFGPIIVKVRRQREKRWVALFTCLTTRAIHLELAANLSTDACVLVIRNFINRRGIPVQMRSENGTNFVGLEKELNNVDDFVDFGAIGERVSNLGIKWKFICPSNPSEGGAWERMVQSVKKVLTIILHNCTPTIETMISVLIEAENIVNSRPLTHIPVTVEEEEPLTPNHFLLNSANSTQTPRVEEATKMCLRK